MTNKQKFIQVMNDTFNAGLTVKNLRPVDCSPCGQFRIGACDSFTCEGCRAWWDKEYKEPDKSAADVRPVAPADREYIAVDDIKDCMLSTINLEDWTEFRHFITPPYKALYYCLLEKSFKGAPGAIPARWEIDPDGYYPYCSHCKQEPPGREMSDFCPNCGADMRQRRAEEQPTELTEKEKT